MQRRGVFQLLAGAASLDLSTLFANSEDQASRNNVAWVRDTLEKMQTIVPGMTREALYRVFTTEGGLSTGLRRTFVSRDCPYFKVDVEFQAVGRPEKNADGRGTLVGDDRDIIVKISRPYLQFSVMD